MPRRSASDAAETAIRVVTTARDVFAREGYAAASLDDIARRAGVTRGAVYHHFRDKRGLFRAVAVQTQAEVAAAVVQSAEARLDPIEQLRSGCHAFLDAVTNADTAHLLLIESPAALGWREWRELDAAASVRELREAVALVAGVSDAHVEAATQMLSGAMNEAALWLVDNQDDADARRAAHAVLDQMVDAVSGAFPAR